MDNYSKTMLTIIAICLVWIAFKDMPMIRTLQADLIGANVTLVNGAINVDRRYTTKYPGMDYLRKDYYWPGGPIPVTIVDRPGALTVTVKSTPETVAINSPDPVKRPERSNLDKISDIGLSVGIAYCRIQGCASKTQADKVLMDVQSLLSGAELDSFNKSVKSWDAGMCNDHKNDAANDEMKNPSSCSKEYQSISTSKNKLVKLSPQNAQ